MFPIFVMGAVGFLAWIFSPKHVSNYSPTTKLAGFQDAPEPAGFLGPPLLPEEERLLSLLVLWSRDKKFPPGHKRYLSRVMAHEMLRLAQRMRLAKTARAIMEERPLPDDEMFARRGISVRQAVLSYGSKN